MRRAASARVADTRRTVTNGVAVSAFVLIVSVALAFVLVRGLSRSLEVLGEAAAHVRQTRDYTTRARKTADDEFGALTDAFNEMLAGIQARDEALEAAGRTSRPPSPSGPASSRIATGRCASCSTTSIRPS
ncbi:HAMP domain-containing protein [Sorangium sp. So ce362]|uniref:HAMP domain-containing protein n=1 Tax=Sorangium sp. So ce362 TaxID=3133303 RepID=UPI003F5DD2DC